MERFLAAVRGGNLHALLEVLDPEVVVVSDGGGVVPAARRPVRGAGVVAGFMAKLSARVDRLELALIWINGAPAVRLVVDGELFAVASVEVDGSRITRVYAVNNPHKLQGVSEAAALSR